MNKRNFKAVETDLSQLAETFPTQHVEKPAPTPEPKAKQQRPKPAPKQKTKTETETDELKSEKVSQVSFGIRESLRDELVQLAFQERKTVRGFILEALKAKGLKVQDYDMADRRRDPKLWSGKTG